jgi:hypothetical protein
VLLSGATQEIGKPIVSTGKTDFASEHSEARGSTEEHGARLLLSAPEQNPVCL